MSGTRTGTPSRRGLSRTREPDRQHARRDRGSDEIPHGQTPSIVGRRQDRSRQRKRFESESIGPSHTGELIASRSTSKHPRKQTRRGTGCVRLNPAHARAAPTHLEATSGPDALEIGDPRCIAPQHVKGFGCARINLWGASRMHGFSDTASVSRAPPRPERQERQPQRWGFMYRPSPCSTRGGHRAQLRRGSKDQAWVTRAVAGSCALLEPRLTLDGGPSLRPRSWRAATLACDSVSGHTMYSQAWSRLSPLRFCHGHRTNSTAGRTRSWIHCSRVKRAGARGPCASGMRRGRAVLACPVERLAARGRLVPGRTASPRGGVLVLLVLLVPSPRWSSAREAGTAYWVLAASRSCGPPSSVGASLADGDGDDVESVVEDDREGCEDCPDEAGASFGVP